jgi:UDP-N-acetylmuramoyl-tripeptide--D-alanyl-D-alanine ligase
MNALAAAAAGVAAQISLAKIQTGLQEAKAVNKRLIEKQAAMGATLIDDSYNANPLSVAAAIRVLAQRPGVSVLALGDMKELGAEAADMHHEIGEIARANGINFLYAYGDASKHAVAAFGEGGFYFADQDKLIAALKKHLTHDMTVLVKGSLSMNMARVVAALESQ